MLKWFLKIIIGILVAIGIVGFAFILLVSYRTTSPGLDILEIKPVFNRERGLSIKAEQERQELIKAKQSLIDRQLARLTNQEEILNNKKKEIEENLERELLKIREKYQARIDVYSDVLEKDYQLYLKKKEQEFHEKVLAQRELYEEKIKEMIKQYEEEKRRELEKYAQDLIKKNYPKKLNYTLKLKTLKLTEQEKDSYEEKLKEIEKEEEEAIKNKEVELEQEIKEKLKELQEYYNQELTHFQQDLEKEISEDLNKKAANDEVKLKQFKELQEDFMAQELRMKEKEIKARVRDELLILEGVISDLRSEYYQLQSELALLEKGSDS